MAEKYTHWDNVPMVTSDALFCLDRHGGQTRWTYRRESGSAILNSTIAADGGRIYFVESRSPAALADTDGRVTLGVALGGTIFSRPVAIDLETGTSVPFNLDRGGHGCGTLSGSASYLFGRGANPRMYPIDGGGRSNTALTTVSRPGCWINVIPAGGLLLIPESSSGCSCAFAVQTSIALAPRSAMPVDQSGGRDNNESVPSP